MSDPSPLSPKTLREMFDEAVSLGKHAANGWACYAKTRKELDEIGRIHRGLDALLALPEGRDQPQGKES